MLAQTCTTACEQGGSFSVNHLQTDERLHKKQARTLQLKDQKEYRLVNNPTTRILLIILVLALAVLACSGGGDGNRSGSDGASSNQSTILSPDATATFGAGQLHIQLTAIAQDGNK